jgi:predicted outer membrane repeat protein
MINQNLTLKGAGSGSTIIDGNQAGSVFTISGGFTVLIADLTIKNGKGNTSIGGGLMNNGDVTLTNVALINNSGPFGSAIRNPSKLTLINSVISNNTNSEAGTILSGGTLTIDKSTFSNNSTLNGGALYIAGGTATINNSTFSGNSSGDGGAIFATGTVTIQNSTISGNSANNGGGLVTNDGATSNVTIVNSTIAGNSAQSGGGIKKYLGSVTLKNTIVAGNNGSNCVGGISSAGYNLSSDGTCALGGPGDLANVDPKLYSLANNGGSTATHALAADSPAINAGDACPAADQRGVTRPQGVRCDIGAYEAPVSQAAQ